MGAAQMSRATKETMPAVPPEKVSRRIAEMRRMAYEAKHPHHVVYHPLMQRCPWDGCGYRIAGIRFQLEQMNGDAEEQAHRLAAWWLGPGLLAKCPGCRRWVLFDVLSKQAVPDPAHTDAPALPEDWHLKAYLLPKAGQ